jgi:hypothetical protein
VEIHLPQPFKRIRQQRGTGNVGNDAGEITDLSFRVKRARLLLAAISKS